VVLFLGIAAAIGATNFLFNFKFEWDTYAILWVWIVGMFTTIFFLAGVPVNTAALDEDLSYPKGH
jgi:low affinity Fe/Cu permease